MTTSGAGRWLGRPWYEAPLAAMGAFMEGLNKELEESGELVETRGLGAPIHTRRLGAEKGVAFVTDGPYAETEEVLAGYWIVECESFDRATEIASRFRDCPAPAHLVGNEFADIRPIMEGREDLEG